jgi:hypothetical protein
VCWHHLLGNNICSTQIYIHFQTRLLRPSVNFRTLGQLTCKKKSSGKK